MKQDTDALYDMIILHMTGRYAVKLEGHSVERMYLRQRCFDGSLAQ